MSNTTSCPNCRRALRVPETLLGHQVKCPACMTMFLAAEEPPAAPAAARPRERRPRDDEEDRRDDRDRREDRDRRDARDRRDDRDDRRRARYDDEDDEEEDRYRYRERERRRRSDRKPDKVQAIAIMMLIGSIFALLVGVALVASCFGLVWPGTYVAIVGGILGIIKAAALLGDEAYRQSPPIAVAVLQIVCILNVDVINLTLGIVELILMNDNEVKDYLRG